MLKNILIKCAEILNREDIVSSLSFATSVDEIEDKQVKYDVIKLISFFNFTMETLSENYFDFIQTETLSSNSDGKIFFYNFSFHPTKIENVFDLNSNPIHFELSPTCIIVSSSAKTVEIVYKCIPPTLKNLNDKILFPENLTKQILCYGIVSEFLASKNMFSESEFWQNKFLYEIYKRKLKKERRMKSTFCK